MESRKINMMEGESWNKRGGTGGGLLNVRT